MLPRGTERRMEMPCLTKRGYDDVLYLSLRAYAFLLVKSVVCSAGRLDSRAPGNRRCNPLQRPRETLSNPPPETSVSDE